jgi:hypothetical protein
MAVNIKLLGIDSPKLSYLSTRLHSVTSQKDRKHNFI